MGKIRLITRRSQVQILSPQPTNQGLAHASRFNLRTVTHLCREFRLPRHATRTGVRKRRQVSRREVRVTPAELVGLQPVSQQCDQVGADARVGYEVTMTNEATRPADLEHIEGPEKTRVRNILRRQRAQIDAPDRAMLPSTRPEAASALSFGETYTVM